MLRFTVNNEVFYNGRLKYIPSVLDNLNLKINNFKQIDIAVDSYKYNAEQSIRRYMLDKNNTIKLLGKIITDRNKLLRERTFYNSGSLNNPYKLRSLLIKGKDGRKELVCYDKKEEINEVSKKEYILKFHQTQDPKLKNVYRVEGRFGYEEINRYSKKIKKSITFDDLLNSQFLSEMFFEYLDRIITIYKGTGKKRVKIQLVDQPKIELSQDILQPTLPMHNSTPLISKNGYFDFDKFINEYSNNLYNNQVFLNGIKNNVNNYISNNKSKYIGV